MKRTPPTYHPTPPSCCQPSRQSSNNSDSSDKRQSRVNEGTYEPGDSNPHCCTNLGERSVWANTSGYLRAWRLQPALLHQSGREKCSRKYTGTSEPGDSNPAPVWDREMCGKMQASTYEPGNSKTSLLHQFGREKCIGNTRGTSEPRGSNPHSCTSLGERNEWEHMPGT